MDHDDHDDDDNDMISLDNKIPMPFISTMNSFNLNLMVNLMMNLHLRS